MAVRRSIPGRFDGWEKSRWGVRPAGGPHLALCLCLLLMLCWRAVIPNGYMLDHEAARAGHYALMPCPAKGWHWPVLAGENDGHMFHGVHDASEAQTHHSSEHISLDCPSGIMLSQLAIPSLWWPPMLAWVPSWSRPLPASLPPRLVVGPSCGPPVGAQAPPLFFTFVARV